MKQPFIFFATLFYTLLLYAPNSGGLASILTPAQKSEYIVERHALKQTISPLTIEQWHQATKNRDPLVRQAAISQYATFRYYLNEYIDQQKKFLTQTHWVNTPVNINDPHLAQATMSHYMRPFVLKYSVQVGRHFYFWGDLHGDTQALCNSFYKLYKEGVIDNNFYILKRECLFFFLGDMVDRGQHGIDTLTLLFTFAIQNPGKVFLIRGNHEDISMNRHPYYAGSEGLDHFFEQLKLFYAKKNPTPSQEGFNQLADVIALFYNTLPVAAFIGCNRNFMQCCHGGLEVRYNPNRLLESPQSLCLQAIEELSEPWTHDEKLQVDPACMKKFARLTQKDIRPSNLGFLWNDFNANPADDLYTFCEERRGFVMGKLLAQEILKKYSSTCSVKGIIRAHQHNSTMAGVIDPLNRGVFTLWDNQVVTTIATSVFSGAASFIELVVENDFKNWRLKNYNLNPIYSDWIIRENTLSNWRNIVI